MDRWTEGDMDPKQKGKYPLKKYILVLAILFVAFVIISYIYACTCYLGEQVCRKNGEFIDNHNPQLMDLDFSFLSKPGRVVYPWSSIMLKEEGSVCLRLAMTEEGVIEEYEIIESSGYPYLDKAALESISTFEIDRTKLNEKEILERNIKITFRCPDE